MQFFTAGCLNGMLGYILYFSCVMKREIKQESSSYCSDIDPGTQISYYTDLSSFLLQILLIWIAFLMLPCSKTKGKPKFRYNNNKEENDEENNTNLESYCCCCSFHINRCYFNKIFNKLFIFENYFEFYYLY